MLLLAAAALPAQQPPAARPMLVDRVEAKVGDDAILYSQVMAAIQDDIKVREIERGRPLTPPELQSLFRQAKDALIDRNAMAQAAKTLGILPPERIEDILRERVAAAEAEEVRKFGTQTRFSQELSRENRTWESWRHDTRLLNELQLTRELTVGGRLQNQTNLFITPRMLREFYDQHRGDYVYDARCRVDVLRIDASGGLEAAKTVAAAAAAMWREQSIDSRQLAEKMQAQQASSGQPVVPVSPAGGPYQVSADLRKTMRPALAEFFLGFADSHQQGDVSEPLQDENNLWLAKIVDRLEGRNSGFDDPEVQASLRHRLETLLIHHLTNEAIKRARDRTYVWDIERSR